jgi:hypothetical protein
MRAKGYFYGGFKPFGFPFQDVKFLFEALYFPSETASSFFVSFYAFF